MRWLTNMHDPRLEEAEFYNPRSFGETPEKAWETMQKYLSDKFIGEPRGNDIYSVEQLRAFNVVGIYAVEENEQIQNVLPNGFEPVQRLNGGI